MADAPRLPPRSMAQQAHAALASAVDLYAGLLEQEAQVSRALLQQNAALSAELEKARARIIELERAVGDASIALSKAAGELKEANAEKARLRAELDGQ